MQRKPFTPPYKARRIAKSRPKIDTDFAYLYQLRADDLRLDEKFRETRQFDVREIFSGVKRGS